MKTIIKSNDNVIECACGTVLEYDKADLTLKGVENTEYYAISVVCPNCGKVHAVKPAEFDSNALIGSVRAKNSLDDYSPEELVNAAYSANADDIFAIHDKIHITLKNGYDAVFEIIGKRHDTKENGEKSALTFCLVDLYGDNENGGKVMNPECTNKGGFDKSEMRTWLNEDFFNLLPDEWQKVIAPVVKKTADGGSSKAKIVETLCKVFLPSEVEVFGKCEYSKKGEGEQYEGFTNWHNRVKGYPDGNYGRYWWVRSPYSGNHASFCVVYDGGSCSGNYASGTGGVAPCFAL